MESRFLSVFGEHRGSYSFPLQNGHAIIRLLGGFLLSAFSLIGKAEGNLGSGGGNVLVCFNEIKYADEVRNNGGIVSDSVLESVQSIEALDLHVARQPRGLPPVSRKIASANQGESYLQFLNRLIARINSVSGRLGNIVDQSRLKLESGIVFRPNAMIQISDTNDIALFDGSFCALTTMAVQHSISTGQGLEIDGRLFFHSRHSVESQAVLLLHEYLYFYSRMNNETNSSKTRDLIAQLLRDEPNVPLNDIALSIHRSGFGFSGPLNDDFHPTYFLNLSLFEIPYQIITGYFFEARSLVLKQFGHRLSKEFESLQADYSAFMIENLPNVSSNNQFAFTMRESLNASIDKLPNDESAHKAHLLIGRCESYLSHLKGEVEALYKSKDLEIEEYLNEYQFSGLDSQQSKEWVQLAQERARVLIRLFDDPYILDQIPPVNPNFDGRRSCSGVCGKRVRMEPEYFLSLDFGNQFSWSKKWGHPEGKVLQWVSEDYFDSHIFDFQLLQYPVLR